MQLPGFAWYFTRTGLMHGPLPDTTLALQAERSFSPERSGDLFPLPRHAGLGVRIQRDLVAQIEREPEAVEPGSQVRRRRRDRRGEAHGYSPSSAATASASAGTEVGAVPPLVAHSGSLSP